MADYVDRAIPSDFLPVPPAITQRNQLIWRRISLAFVYSFLLCISPAILSADKPAVIPLPMLAGKTYKEMCAELGAPIDKTGYTIKNAPTKSWNQKELFARYPKIKKNESIQIMEVTWDAGEYLLLACFHMVDGENRCLVAKKIAKGIVF